MMELRSITDPLYAASKRLLDGSDDSRSDAEAKAEHHAIMVQLVQALQSMS